MKKNRIEKSGKAGVWKKVFALVALAALAVGAWRFGVALRKAFLAQCVITDMPAQVSIATGQTTKEGVVLELFGIRKGVNLAEIDFAEKREKILAKYPAIRSATVRRHLPDKIEIHIEERVPVAKMNEVADRRAGKMKSTGRVVDLDGVVFMKSAGTEALPTICERAGSATKPGARLSGRAKAALELLSLSRQSPYSDLGIMRIDAAGPDYLLAILGDYSPAKIAWEGMDDQPSPASRKAMEKRLSHLRKSVLSGVAPAGTRPVVWNATEPDRVFADTKEPIL